MNNRQDGAASVYESIYSVVRRIPAGRVATYGQVAALAGFPGHARQVGYALNALDDDSDVPWHRVINAGGGISIRTGSAYHEIQRALLDSEGVIFDEKGRVQLSDSGWKPQRVRNEDRR